MIEESSGCQDGCPYIDILAISNPMMFGAEGGVRRTPSVAARLPYYAR